MTAPPPTALEVAELRALVRGREPAAVLDRLGALVRILDAGDAPGPEDQELVARMRHEYGHELAELRDPEG